MSNRSKRLPRFIARRRGISWVVVDTMQPATPPFVCLHKVSANQTANSLNREWLATIAANEQEITNARLAAALGRISKS
jgi:hypothetical protein